MSREGVLQDGTDVWQFFGLDHDLTGVNVVMGGRGGAVQGAKPDCGLRMKILEGNLGGNFLVQRAI